MAAENVVILMGPPGAGKGTQAKMLAQKFGFAHISTGDILRQEVRSGTPLGAKVEKIMNSGALVPDQLVAEIVGERLGSQDAPRDILLDGFPRTVPQAEYLESLPGDFEQIAVNLHLSEEEVVRRLAGRRHCAGCGRIYNVYYSAPTKEDVCDACGGGLLQRPDDAETVVRERLRVYQEQTRPLIEFYKSREGYFEVDGSLNMDSVFEELSSLVAGHQSRA